MDPIEPSIAAAWRQDAGAPGPRLSARGASPGLRAELQSGIDGLGCHGAVMERLAPPRLGRRWFGPSRRLGRSRSLCSRLRGAWRDAPAQACDQSQGGEPTRHRPHQCVFATAREKGPLPESSSRKQAPAVSRARGSGRGLRRRNPAAELQFGADRLGRHRMMMERRASPRGGRRWFRPSRRLGHRRSLRSRLRGAGRDAPA